MEADAGEMGAVGLQGTVGLQDCSGLQGLLLGAGQGQVKPWACESTFPLSFFSSVSLMGLRGV